MTELQQKFWQPVLNSLEKPNEKDSYFSYFVGGSLCMDTPNGCLALDVNGTFISLRTLIIKPSVLPDKITQKVQELYLDTKGETQYFIDNAKILNN